MADRITQEPASSSASEPQVQADKPGGWAELWLVGVNAGVALAIAALLAALALTLTQAGGLTAVRDVMWTLFVMGICIFLLCLAGYRSQR
jgi:hypothetical protein